MRFRLFLMEIGRSTTCKFEVVFMKDILDFMVTYGAAFVVLAYFIFKDYKFTGRITELIGKVETLLNTLNKKDESDDHHEG